MNEAADKYGVPVERRFTLLYEFIKSGIECDFVVNATMDEMLRNRYENYSCGIKYDFGKADYGQNRRIDRYRARRNGNGRKGIDLPRA